MLMVLYRSSQEGVIFKKRQNHHYVRSLPTCLTFTFITSLSHPMDVCRKSGYLFKDIYLFLAEIFIQCFLFLFLRSYCFSQRSMIKGRFCNYTFVSVAFLAYLMHYVQNIFFSLPYFL